MRVVEGKEEYGGRGMRRNKGDDGIEMAVLRSVYLGKCIFGLELLPVSLNACRTNSVLRARSLVLDLV